MSYRLKPTGVRAAETIIIRGAGRAGSLHDRARAARKSAAGGVERFKQQADFGGVGVVEIGGGGPARGRGCR